MQLIILAVLISSTLGALQLSDSDSRVIFGQNTAVVTNLYRNGTTTLRTDGNLIVGGNLTVLGNSLVDAGLILHPTTVYVGPARQFKSLPAAYNWIQTKAILAPLTVQLDVGTYNITSQLTFQALSSPQLITIQGSISAPQNYVVKCLGAGCSSSGMFAFSRGASGLMLRGLTLSNPTGVTNAYAVTIEYDTIFFSYVHITSFNYVISVSSRGTLNTDHLVITGCGGDCVTVSYNSYIDLLGASITGTGTARGLVVIGGWANANNVAFHTLSVGFICYTSVLAYVQTGGSASFSSVTTPINCPSSNYD